MATSFNYNSSIPSWFDDLEDGIILIRGGMIRSINRAAATMLDVNPDKVAGMSVIAILRDHRLERAYLEGSAVELETRGRKLRAWGINGGLCLRDISTISQAQDNARELLAVLSHELRTPVTTIRATLEALHYDLPEPQRQNFLQRAETETQRLMRLLEDLTIDVKPPYARSLDLADVATRALSLLQDTFETRCIRVSCDLEPLTVWADTDKLMQVLINLLENAAIHGPDNAVIQLKAFRYLPNYDDITQLEDYLNLTDKHLPNEPPPLLERNATAIKDTEAEDTEAVEAPSQHVADHQVSNSHVAEGPATAHIVVRDSGTPLDVNVVEQLFQPHAQGSPKSKGTGLGLYIVRSIAARWGGSAWGQPLPDGNEFGVSVPLSRH
ncbi:MAG: ATP-binding protein [Deinococcota bacterium]